jgi:hypothetical protein
MSTVVRGPHQSIAQASPREEFLAQLLDTLWDRYRQRVSYVAQYEQAVRDAGGTFVNDHIAFRTFAIQEPAAGIFSLSRIFQALGYRSAGNYHFEDKNLSAIHYQHPNSQFPKLFISELRTWELPPAAREIVYRIGKSHRPQLSDDLLSQLSNLDRSTASNDDLLDRVVDWFHELPWMLPTKTDVLALNKHSQYAAWVAVHGYNVNHFTSLVNSHGVDRLNDLEGTISALRDAGVPMKSEIEGEPGSKLRQTATEAVTIPVGVRDEFDKVAALPWSYAYFELAERNEVIDATTGKKSRFEGFLGPQATNLFEMTRVK